MRLWGLFAKTTSPHGSRFVNFQLSVAHPQQYLRIKAFYGTSENAVKIQIWIAISVYVLVAILKKELKLHRSLGEILQILSITLFEKDELHQVLTTMDVQNEALEPSNQLILFDL